MAIHIILSLTIFVSYIKLNGFTCFDVLKWIDGFIFTTSLGFFCGGVQSSGKKKKKTVLCFAARTFLIFLGTDLHGHAHITETVGTIDYMAFSFT